MICVQTQVLNTVIETCDQKTKNSEGELQLFNLGAFHGLMTKFHIPDSIVVSFHHLFQQNRFLMIELTMTKQLPCNDAHYRLPLVENFDQINAVAISCYLSFRFHNHSNSTPPDSSLCLLRSTSFAISGMWHPSSQRTS